MATAQRGTLMQLLHDLALGRAERHGTDRQLLEDFASRRNESAFAGLVERHGPMVLRVCRRVLRHEQDAEDAFQATFLVLARHPASIRKREGLASWLHGVAYRTALKARRSAARRRNHEARLRDRTPPPAPSPTWDDVQAVLDEEIRRLPASWRSAFVSCVLDAKTVAAAAAELGVKAGTLSWWLARARRRLRQRLARRGIQLAAVLAALSVADSIGHGAVAPTLAQATVRAGLLIAAGVSAADVISPHVAALAAGVTRAMLWTKARIAVCVLLALALTSAGVGILARPAAATGEPSGGEQRSEVRGQKSEVGEQKPRRAAEGMAPLVEVSGRVLDPEGKPVARARVTFHQRRPPNEHAEFFPAPVADTTDAGGRFRFSAPIHPNAPARERPPLLTLTGHVPGYGPAATVEAGSADEFKNCTLRLVKDDVPIRGRVLNLEGRPVAGVTVRPIAVIANAAGDLGRLVQAIKTDGWDKLPKEHRTDIVFAAAAAGLTQTARTDTDGQFTLSGFGRERIVVLRLDGPTIETSLLNVMTRVGPTVHVTRPRGGAQPPPRTDPPQSPTYVYAYGAHFDFAAGPGMVVEGTVRDQDSGKPLAGVTVRQGIPYEFGWATEDEVSTRTDAAGHYRLAGGSRSSPRAHGAIEFVPPRHAPYLWATFSPPAPDQNRPVRLDVGLKRGLLVKGRVTDKATGKPVQAIVEYFAFRTNANLVGIKGFAGSHVVSSTEDGSFTLAALRGPGIVAARTDDMGHGAYLIGQGASAIRGPWDARIRSFVTAPYMCWPRQFEVLAAIDPGAETDTVTCNLQFDPGKAVRGTILDADGKPLAGVTIRGPFGSTVGFGDLPTAAFTIPAVDPQRPEVYFFDHAKKHLAAAVILKGDEAAGFTVKLQPTATVTGRVLTEDGEPVANTYFWGRLEAGQLNMTQPYNGFFWGNTDAAGRFKIEGLLPGVKLSANARFRLFEKLTFKPGEVRDLGDVKIKAVPE